MKDKYKRLILAAVCMACAGICYSMNSETASQAVIYEEAPQDDCSEGASVSYAGSAVSHDYEGKTDGQAEAGEENPEETRPSFCYVHICGEVVSPGVYQVEEGSRIFQAVEAAGGLTGQAAEEYLNLAGRVEDGMKIVVLSEDEVRKMEASGWNQTSKGQGISEAAGISGVTGNPENSGDRKVNLNTATKEELMTLSGIGESRAEDIIRYREEQGGFLKIEDIKKVSGIKEALFQKIKDKIRV